MLSARRAKFCDIVERRVYKAIEMGQRAVCAGTQDQESSYRHYLRIELATTARKAPPVSEDSKIMIWKTFSGACIQTIREHTGGILTMALTVDGKFLATGSNNGSILVNDFEKSTGWAWAVRAGGYIDSVVSAWQPKSFHIPF